MNVQGVLAQNWLCQAETAWGREWHNNKRTGHVAYAGACQPYRRQPGAHRRCVSELRTRILQRPAGPHAGRQDQPDAPDGGAGSTRQGTHPDEWRGRHRRAGASAQRLDGLSAVHQLPDPDGLREHRLAPAPGRRGRGRDHRQGPGHRADAAHRWLAQTLSAGAVGRSAAAHGHGPGAGQGCFADPVR